MATVGLKNLYFAKNTKDDSTGVTYDAPARLGAAIQVDINPQNAKNTLYADDAPFAVASSITEITVNINTADIAPSVVAALGGHDYDSITGAVTYKASDTPPYVAIMGESEKHDGKTRYFKLLKGKFNETQETIQTKGEKVEFTTPKLEGSFVAREYDGKWKVICDADSSNTTIASAWYASVEAGI